MMPSRSNFGTNVMRPGQQPPSAAPAYAAGGAIDTGDNPMMGTMGAQLQFDLNSALGVVGNVLAYGRKLHGLGGDEDSGEGSGEGGAIETAGVMPTVPFSESQRDRPMPGPLPPTSNPFGKRAEAEPDAEPDSDSDDTGVIDTEETA